MKKVISLYLLLLAFNNFSAVLPVAALPVQTGNDSLTQGDTLVPSKEKSPEKNKPKKIYKFHIKDQIAPPVMRQTNQAIEEAHRLNANYIFIEMNTYGGLVDAADSIRTKILHSKIPVIVLIENNAASAGALIAIACDSIYMQAGSTIGAATVVDQQGQVVPDKYQSYMRKKMRATAEINGRDPLIAEAMVDPDIVIPGIIDSGKVITFSTLEAIKYNYCEGQFETLDEIMKHMGIERYEVVEYQPTTLEKIIGFLINPAVSGILIMLIMAGIYFELQTPGVGFPLIAAVTAATLYFAPLYLEGLAANWEILIFIIGLILLGVEIFAIPGFGIAGISGIVLMIGGLTLSLINNIGFDFTFTSPDYVIRSLLIVIIATILSISLSLYFGGKFLASSLFRHAILNTTQSTGTGYPGTGYPGAGIPENNMTGKIGVATTMLRPSGKVEIEGEIYDATALIGYIDKGTAVRVVKFETAQLFVQKI